MEKEHPHAHSEAMKRCGIASRELESFDASIYCKALGLIIISKIIRSRRGGEHRSMRGDIAISGNQVDPSNQTITSCKSTYLGVSHALASWVQISWRHVKILISVEETDEITTLERDLRMRSILIFHTCSRINSCKWHTRHDILAML